MKFSTCWWHHDDANDYDMNKNRKKRETSIKTLKKRSHFTESSEK